MKRTISKAIMDALNASTALTAILGANTVKMGHIDKTASFPCVSFFENNESGKKRAGYNLWKQRDHNTTLQIDIFSKTTWDQTMQIEEIIDKLLMANISGTRSWIKIYQNNLFEEDTNLYHKVIRYSFEYLITDT